MRCPYFGVVHEPTGGTVTPRWHSVVLAHPPAASRELRPKGRFAVELLQREVGAEFTSLDDGSKAAMVDGLFVLRGCSRGHDTCPGGVSSVNLPELE